MLKITIKIKIFGSSFILPPMINILLIIFSNRKFGFHAYALDLIRVPSVIKRYLMKNYDMHNIPIGSKEVINHLQHLPNNIGFFFAGNLLNY